MSAHTQALAPLNNPRAPAELARAQSSTKLGTFGCSRIVSTRSPTVVSNSECRQSGNWTIRLPILFRPTFAFAARGEALPRLADLFLDPSWLEALPGELGKAYFANLEKFVGQEVSGKVPIYPPQASIFRAFNTCPFEKVKVVILGQVRVGISLLPKLI